MLKHIGRVITVTGQSTNCGYEDGTMSEALFYYPGGMSLDSITGALFVIDRYNDRIRIVYPFGEISTLMPNGDQGARARIMDYSFYTPNCISYCERTKDLYVVDRENTRLRRVHLKRQYYPDQNRHYVTVGDIDIIVNCDSQQCESRIFTFSHTL